MNYSQLFNNKGFTLIELLITLVLVSIVSGSIHSVFSAQNKSFQNTLRILEMETNARVGLDILVKKVRQAGYNPSEETTGIFGLGDSDFEANDSATALTDNTSIYFTADLDEDKILASGNTERLAFQYDAVNLEIEQATISGAGVITWQPLVEGITSLTFTYTYEDGTSSNGVNNLPDNLVSNNKFTQVRSVVISVTARTSKINPYTGDYSTETLTSTVNFRNIL